MSRRTAVLRFQIVALAVFALCSRAAAADQGAKPAQPERHWTVYLLPHSHVDIGYTHLQSEVERKQWQNIDAALDLCRQTADYPPDARFRWNTEVLWAVDSYLRQQPPEKQQRLIEAVRAGQIGLDALYGNELTALCRPEELLRLCECAQRLSKRCGVKIESAMITDVPGCTWGIVPAFAQAGVKYFSLCPNFITRPGRVIASWGDRPFWWIGPNGHDRVLAWLKSVRYCQVVRSPRQLQEHLRQLEQDGYPYDAVQIRHCLGDNHLPDLELSQTVKKWNESHVYPRLVIATTAEMFRAFVKQYGDKVPEFRGDLTPYWEDGAASSARETALNRAAAERLVQAEALWAMLAPGRYPTDRFSTAWRNVVLYDEHTWAPTTASTSPICRLSRISGRTSRRSRWTATPSRGNCWPPPWPAAATAGNRRPPSTCSTPPAGRGRTSSCCRRPSAAPATV